MSASPSFGGLLHGLELRVPPVALGIAIAAAMWLARPSLDDLLAGSLLRRLAAALLFAAGLTFVVAGVRAFRRARTTVNPMTPGATSSLVVDGIYHRTRNPMYVGFAAMLLGWAVALAAPAASLGPAVFVAWITRFQILPEERMLAVAFGDEFAAYRQRVRRWL
ncbi:MAG: isoprenylcysteine carboxylmethyltransferase family protein [Steroidobacteraceae bacterium]